MFSLPMFLGADATAGGVARVLHRSARGDSRSAASSSGTTPRGKYVPAARAALREGRAARRRTGGWRMKAVILAGGEGTRLRPLTSNQPKPMMPIANVPMMEHIVQLLARARLRRHRGHGRVPREPHPQLLRRRLRVRRAHALRDRGIAARHRRLGAQRDGRARRDVPRDLRRRAHRHRPRRDRRAAHTTATRSRRSR